MKESVNMIGIFDSGIGGVTVLKEILKDLPNYHYVYYSDSINNPYGDKTKEELCLITKNIVEFLISKGCKIIVIACNTASAICKEYLRSVFNIPIIAIEPAYKMVYDYHYQERTLVMATKGTIESEKFLELYHKYDNHKTNIIPCSGLADLIEQDKKEEINNYLKKNLKYDDIKNVVLGCTHYPLIKEEIKEVLGDVTFFDGSIGVTKKLNEIIKNEKLNSSQMVIEFYDSSLNKTKEKRFREILKKV